MAVTPEHDIQRCIQEIYIDNGDDAQAALGQRLLELHSPLYLGTGLRASFIPLFLDPEVELPLTLPPRVEECVSTLERLGIWFLISHNGTALSCADAASQRRDEGLVGVDLEKEIKTLLLRRRGGLGYVAANLCASHKVDMPALRAVVDETDTVIGKTSSVGPEELAEVFGAEFGTVNPVLLSLSPAELTQVWDNDLFRPAVDESMFTNAGHHNYAMRFLPGELFDRLPNCVCGNISASQTEPPDNF